jgi:putative FmdB family regulatory protein
MPLYHYKCEDCSADFEVRHGMFFESQRCTKCMSEHVFKVPSIGDKAPEESNSPQRTGKIVDKYIKDAKEEVRAEKKKLSSEEM